MSTLLETLVEWIIVNDLGEGDGIDLFRDVIPDKPDKLICLLEYNSKTSRNKFNTAAVRYVQVVARDFQASECKKAIDKLYELFSCREDEVTDLPNDRWAIMFPLQLPFKVREDANRRIYYGFNMAITTSPD